MDPNALAGMGFVLFILTLVTIIAVVVIWQVLKTAREKTRYAVELAINDAYRRLAEQAVAVEEKMAKDIADLRARVASMENLLREIE
ncbi:MAG TPA: hypothetical protein GXZ96_06495 [Firmicutes bacterium]|jgi:hypothetical protein|nr:hypothetical protein [Bacillota bacterium]